MLSFANDYSLGAAPEILTRLAACNNTPNPGYGTDDYCRAATEKIRAACACPDAAVYFLVGGTQTNEVVINTMLAPYEGVLAAATGHIHCHEAGAVEHGGHKILPLPETHGKLNAADIRRYCADFYADANHEHMIYPGMVYLSHPTEYGTLYSKAELEEITAVCKEYNMPLFLDGARLGYALASPASDLSLGDIARLCDVFYIGGTKVGALFGEAVVFTRQNAPRHFTTLTKQHGAMLAKGWLLGLQFDTLFTDGLYHRLAQNAIEMAERLKAVLHGAGIPFFLETDTNQQFLIFENEMLAALQKEVTVSFWEKADDDHTVVRFATSWGTTAAEIEKLSHILERLGSGRAE